MGSIKSKEKTWLDVKDVATLCGITSATVYGWIKNNKVSTKTSYSSRKGRMLIDVSTLPKRYIKDI